LLLLHLKYTFSSTLRQKATPFFYGFIADCPPTTQKTEIFSDVKLYNKAFYALVLFSVLRPLAEVPMSFIGVVKNFRQFATAVSLLDLQGPAAERLPTPLPECPQAQFGRAV
jgi:hypothetical protein